MTWQITPSDGFNQGRPLQVKDEEEVERALTILFTESAWATHATVLDLSGESDNWLRQVSRAEYRRH